MRGKGDRERNGVEEKEGRGKKEKKKRIKEKGRGGRRRIQKRGENVKAITGKKRGEEKI